MEIRKAVLTGSLELDDSTQVTVPEVTADPASGGQVMVHFGTMDIPAGRRVVAARVRNEDMGAEFSRRLPFDVTYRPGVEVARGDTLSVAFGIDGATIDSWACLFGGLS